jgi:outer membrane receptor for ferrienterochelin and colicin
MKRLLLIFLLLLSINSFAQKKYTISGIIKDAKSGETLISASVYDVHSNLGTSTNVYGFYSLTIKEGKHTIAFSYTGYKTVTKEIDLRQDMEITISLGGSIVLKDVIVSANSASKKVERTQMSLTNINIEQIKAMPAFLGEPDVIKAIQLLPGVQSGSEGSSGLYVRGGGPDQNLMLLDGVPVYNANHLFGFFSVFNPDAIHHVDLYKGGFPARFGGRLSSVIDIRMKEGNQKKMAGSFSIGLISSKFNLEGPIIKDRTSFNISARRTYIDLLTKPFMKKGAKFGYYFYDFNAKINHKFSDKSRLFLSVYMGSDVGGGDSEDSYSFKEGDIENKQKSIDHQELSWGNITSALRWNYIISNKLFSNTTITYSKYDFGINFSSKESTYSKDSSFNPAQIEDTENLFSFDYTSGIYDLAYKLDFDYLPNPNHSVKFGANYIYHSFVPGTNRFKSKDIDNTSVPRKVESENKTFGNNDINAHEFSVYLEDDMTIFANLKANIGLHYSAFKVQGTFYDSFEPRLGLRYLLNEQVSIKGAYSKMQQYVHLLSNSTVSMPTDLWLPVTDRVKPMNSSQYALGVAYDLQNGFDLSVEAFYKDMNNIIAYKEGASFFGYSKEWEDLVEMGKAWAYGAEFLINKTIGKTTGWLGYTLAWSDRKFETINFGKEFPARYDRRHDVSLAIIHKPSEKIDFGLTWVYGTGNAVTLATKSMNISVPSDISYLGNYDSENTKGAIDINKSRNNYRMPAYHRMDFSVSFHKKKKYGTRTWNISVYNMYNRANPFYLYFSSKDGKDGQKLRVLKQVSLFTIIPSVSYTYKF